VKKRRGKTSNLLSPRLSTPGDDVLHFRLCHLCLHLNESQADIIQCERCHRYLTIESMVEERLRLGKRWRGGSEKSAEEGYTEDAGSDRIFGLNGLAVLW